MFIFRLYLIDCRNFSVSLLAVPFPRAIALILYASMRYDSFFADKVNSDLGGVGYIVSLCRRFPCSSRQTILQPVLYPGSIARTLLCPRGGAKSSCRALSANRAIAVLSAFSLLNVANSFLRMGDKPFVTVGDCFFNYA